jgi:type IV pilus assembly protein PilM
MKLGGENFYHDQPLFGLDIGHSSVKAMELELRAGHPPKVLGYGIGKFPSQVKMNGVITNYELLGKHLYEFFKNGLTGNIYTRRVACSLPTSHSFNRLMKLPVMDDSEIDEAIRLEAEQYIPMPVDKLYIDYEIASRDASGIELLMVATPTTIVDSYVKFLESIDLEPVALEPSMSATSRVFSVADPSHNKPTVLIDFGAISIDLAVFDNTMVVNTTLAGGSELLTKLIGEAMNVSPDEAFQLKSKYGIGVSEKQQKIMAAIQPVLDDLIKEVHRILRYYTDRVGQNHPQISRIVTSGGGATMPGINQFLNRELNLPSETLDPWSNLDFGHLKKPPELHQSAYITVAGEAILNPREIYV